MLTDNLQKSAEIVNDFRIKWSGFLRDLEQFSEIAQRLDEYSDDWRVRISSLTADDGCKPFQTTLDEGLSQSDRFSEVIGTISDEINSIRAEERLNLISRYSETSIKLNYVQTTSSTLAALEQRLGNVLRFNAKIIEANTFRFDVELGGLAGRLHTNYHQYAKPMKILSNLYAEGIKLVKALESFNGVSQSKKSAAIQSQNALNNEILMDIEWLEEIGWKGQFNWQILTAKGWFSTSQRPECKKLSGTYLTLSNSVNDNYAKFENSLEPLYLQVAHLCEAF
ncbi:MAG: hypothetical protein EOP04_15905 [Proteobacteria bacterium]|nr:MAG: hypothetical protein EOP04_15905 [Pseudomonadota bacterium]